MASQPIISFSEPAYRQPKPKVSFAVIAGQGAQATDAAVKMLPAETQAATLDELAWRGMTEHLIATAEKLLSPRMYAAFLRWGEAASHFSTAYETDEEGDARCVANSEAVRALAATSSANVHDLLLKVHLTSLETGDCGAFGYLEQAAFDGHYLTERLSRGSADDVLWLASIPPLINELASKARQASPPDLRAIDPAIGSQITSAFSHARMLNAASRGELAFGPHERWLRERNEVIGLLNAPDADESQEEELCAKLNQLDSCIFETPAESRAAMFAQLILAVQIFAEGHQISEEAAKGLVGRSEQLFGVGTLAGTGVALAEQGA